MQLRYLPLPRRRRKKKKMEKKKKRLRPQGAPVETLPAGDREPFPFHSLLSLFVSSCSGLKGGVGGGKKRRLEKPDPGKITRGCHMTGALDYLLVPG